MGMLGQIKVYAFKGFSSETRTSLDIILRAFEFGADGIVLDVCLARGGALVVCPAEVVQLEVREIVEKVDAEILLWVKEPQVLDLVARLIEKSGAINRVGIVVEDLLHARVVKNALNTATVVLRVSNPFPNVALISREGVSGLALSVGVLRPRLVRECSSRGLQVYAWLVNDISQAIKALRYGVKLFVTSRPTLKRELEHYAAETILR